MIESFNNHFKQICSNLNSKKKVFVLGLSGGLDSMTLLYLLKRFLENNNKFEIEIFPIIVDHNIRQGSSKEACQVQNLSQQLGFKTTIKKIHCKIPSGNIQDWARKKRRDILCESTYELSANLLLAHHFDDQAETLFMRFEKKSGLDGLRGMQSVTFWNGILIIRPLLSFKKKQLRSFVDYNKITFFEDTSNKMLKFERVKTRYMLEKIRKKNWPEISQDLYNFSKINSTLIKKIKFIFTDWISQNIFIDNSGAGRVNYKNLKVIFEKSNLITINIVGKIIQTVGGKQYPPKRRKTYGLICSIFYNNHKNKTLGNVKIFVKSNFLFFIRENRNISFNMNIKKDTHYLFDGRFLINSGLSGNLIPSSTSDLNTISKENIFYDYKDIINNTIPSLQTLEGLNIKPHLNIIINNNVNLNKNNRSFSLYLINRVLV